MSIEKRLLRLADSFADEVSRLDEERFKARVRAAFGLSGPGGTPQTVTGAGDSAGPHGGASVRERQ